MAPEAGKPLFYHSPGHSARRNRNGFRRALRRLGGPFRSARAPAQPMIDSDRPARAPRGRRETLQPPTGELRFVPLGLLARRMIPIGIDHAADEMTLLSRHRKRSAFLPAISEAFAVNQQRVFQARIDLIAQKILVMPFAMPDAPRLNPRIHIGNRSTATAPHPRHDDYAMARMIAHDV